MNCARLVITHVLSDRISSQSVSYDIALMDSARHVIKHMLSPRFSSYVVLMTWRAPSISFYRRARPSAAWT
jgi:hypothetical protein